MELTLPTDLIYEVFSHVQDKPTIDNALKVAPDIVHRAVTRVYSPRVDEELPEYLTAFPRLERTTNVLVRVNYHDLGNLRPLSHLRSLCVEVPDAYGIHGIERLMRIFQVEAKRDDQLFVFRDRYWSACFHNSHCISLTSSYARVGFTYEDSGDLRPRCYFDLLQSVRPLVGGNLGRVLDIVLKYRRVVGIDPDAELLRPIAEQVGNRFDDLIDYYMRDFIADAGYAGKPSFDALTSSISEGYDLPWRLLHYYDIPDHPMPYTREEIHFVENTIYG